MNDSPITKLDPKTDGSSKDILGENIERMRELFPEVFTENSDEDVPRWKVDLDALGELLGEYVEDKPERYSFNWHGKARARRIAQTPSTGTLRPCPEESVNWDTTKNIFIEGDNLEVLKLLQKSYHKKVKMIYIDPPYNTGKEFIYPDKFQDNLDTYLKYTGQVGEDGLKISANSETGGRYHTNWLNMMYPRLKLARNLLRDDGFLFISINDIEYASLRLMCNEIFGEENFVANFVWNTEGKTDNQLQVKVNHEYVVCFKKSSMAQLEFVIDPNTRPESNLWKGFAENSITQNGSGNPIREITLPIGFPCSKDDFDLPASEVPESFYDEANAQGYISRDLTQRYSMSYPIRKDALRVRKGRLEKPCRLFTGWKSFAQLKSFIDGGCQPIVDDTGEKTFFLTENGTVYYRKERDSARNIVSVLRNMGTTEQMKYELEAIGIPFDYPKPKELISYLVRIGSGNGGIVLDFFAGSCPVAQAVTELNESEDTTDVRSYICVQLPESCSDNAVQR